jgi:chemotaxis protein methyltransferase CheR
VSLAPLEFDYLRRLVKGHAAIVIDPAKAYLVESRLAPLVHRHGCTSLRDFLHLLRSQSFGALHHEAVAAMANNETWFFRDSNPCTALSQHILPRLLSARPRDHVLSIWSAACSTGQEPYSIAMLLRQSHLPGARRACLLATDLCESALAYASRAGYRQMEVNRGLPSALLTRYFVQRGLSWQLKPEITGMVSFRALNLAAPWPALPPMDIIFLRNVLIYFDTATRRHVLERIHRTLCPDGFLFLGSAETPRDLDQAFEPVEAGTYVCYQPRNQAPR